MFTRRTAIPAAVLAFVFLVLQYLEGRPLWCKSGFGLWTGAWDHCTSQQLIDPYTFSHLLHGVIFCWALRPLAHRLTLSRRMLAAMALEFGWELLENSAWVIERYRQQTASLDYFGDSVLNSSADIVAAVAGFAFASRLTWRASVVVFLLFELGLLITVRDNLTLNVLMLIHPLETVKQWQLSP